MTFTRIDHTALDPNGIKPSLICPVKDEMALLPHFMRHHRKMGVRQFIFIDNASIDGTADFLSAQDDCVVYYTDEPYRKSAYATHWINRILCDVGYEGWLIYLDVDEHLVYSGLEAQPIDALLARLQAQGADCAFAAMIDTYPQGGFLNLKIGPNDDLAQELAWFDADYAFRPWPKRPWDPDAKEFRLQVLGGPRCRLLSSLGKERRRGAAFYTFANQIDRFIDLAPQSWMPALARWWPTEVPAQQKTPINYVRPGFAYSNSHLASNRRAGRELLGLLHYKFCQELQQRFRLAFQAEAAHYRRGLSYYQLQAALERQGGLDLIYAGSRRYRTSDDLEALGLIGPRAAALWDGSGAREVLTGPMAAPTAGETAWPDNGSSLGQAGSTELRRPVRVAR